MEFIKYCPGVQETDFSDPTRVPIQKFEKRKTFQSEGLRISTQFDPLKSRFLKWDKQGYGHLHYRFAKKKNIYLHRVGIRFGDMRVLNARDRYILFLMLF